MRIWPKTTSKKLLFASGKKKHRLPEHPSQIRAYIFKTAYRVFIDKQRQRKKEVALLQDLHYEAYLSTLETQGEHNEQQVIKLRSEIEKLPKQCKRVFMLSKVQGLKYKEIAAHLQISQKTVEAHISRALKQLRTQLTGLL